MSSDTQAMHDSTDSNDEMLGALVEEYMERIRRGEQPTIEEFAQQHPTWRMKSARCCQCVVSSIHVGEPSETQDKSGRDRFSSLTPNTILGDYRILREVGRGGMGVVYEAEHTTLKRRVALKVLPQRTRDQIHKERFYREARAAAKLHHTNIVPVFDFGEDDGTPFFAMQFIDGRGLDQFVSWARLNESDIDSGSISGFWGRLNRAAGQDSSGFRCIRTHSLAVYCATWYSGSTSASTRSRLWCHSSRHQAEQSDARSKTPFVDYRLWFGQAGR